MERFDIHEPPAFEADQYHAHSLNDDIIFSDFNIKKVGLVLHPVQAGITRADSLYFCRYNDKTKYSEYMYVLEYVVSGRGVLECGGKKHKVHGGDLYLINRSSLPYCYADPDEPFEKKWVHICGRYMNALCHTYSVNEPIVVVQADGEPYMDRIHEILLEYDFSNSEPANFRIMQILLEIFQLIGISQRSTAEKPERVVFNQVLEYISSNITFDRLSPKQISSYFYISYRTLNRMFLKNLGIPPTKYITAQKIEYAKQLLMTTGNTVERIADMLNFSSTQHFRKVFTAHCGLSPTKWKKMNAGGKNGR